MSAPKGRSQPRTTIGSDYDSYADSLDGAAAIPEALALRAAGNLQRLVADPDERALFAQMLGLPIGVTPGSGTPGETPCGVTGHDSGDRS
ncbi:hypothetical protein FRAHR75_770030 [Frankia sp. Hr75.2]|nr:hypothetical protein FRAHR75_770030 [Frankia sp. Hr75.2]